MNVLIYFIFLGPVSYVQTQDGGVADIVMKFSLCPGCTQIIRDESAFSHDMTKKVILSKSHSTIILGSNYSSDFHCIRNVIVGESVDFAVTILKGMPFDGSQRIVIFTSEESFKDVMHNLDKVNGAMAAFDVLLAVIGTTNRFWIRKQPDEFLGKLDDLNEPWTRSETGVKNFKQKEIIITAYNYSIFSYIGPPGKDGNPEWIDGYEMNTLKEISFQLNLSIKIVVPNTTGFRGSYAVAASQLLVKGEIDLIASGFWMIPSLVVDGYKFTKTITESCARMVVPRPTPVDVNLSNVFSPFRIDLWLFSIALTFAAGWILRWVMISSNGAGRPYVDFVLIVLSILLGNTCTERPDGIARQIYSWLLAYANLILSSSFSSSLVSHLTTPNYDKKMNTIQDLVENDFNWMGPYPPGTNMYLREEDEWHRKWLEKYEEFPLDTPEQYGEYIRRTMEEKYAMACQQIGSGIVLFFPLPEHALVKYEPIDYYLTRLQEAGIIPHLINRYFHNVAPSQPHVRQLLQMTKREMSSLRTLTIMDLSGAFVTLLIGHFLATFVFMIEMKMCGLSLKRKRNQRHKKKCQQIWWLSY